ncbi:MAG TPA: glycosyltransferase family 87 protein [Terriglobales bacterium]|nr:glycosyltransferase family 87 protein [Terriglobales bacterium]
MVPNLRFYKPIVIAATAFLLAVQILVIIRSASPEYHNPAEFRQLYAAGSVIRTGHDSQLYCNGTVEGHPENGDTEPLVFDRLAYEGLLFVPLSLLNFPTAYISFLTLNLGLLTICLRLLLPYFENFQQVWRWMAPALFFLFLPVAFALTQGADSILLFVLLTAAATSFYRERNFLAGIFLGLAIFKFQFVIPIILLFVFWRRWTMLWGFIVSATGAMVASAGLMGVTGFRCYIQSVISWFVPISSHPNGASGMMADIPNLRCFFASLFGSFLPPNLLLTVIAVASVTLLLWAGTRTPNFALATMVAVLVSYHGSMSDAVLLILPATFVLDARLAVTEWRRTLSRDIAALLFILPSLLYLAGASYCWLVLLILPTLIPLRFIKSDWRMG